MLPELMAQYGGSINEAQMSWQGDVLQFSFQALGYRFRGTLEANDAQVVLDMALPLSLHPFESAIRAKLEEKLAEVFLSDSVS